MLALDSSEHYNTVFSSKQTGLTPEPIIEESKHRLLLTLGKCVPVL